MSHPVFSDFTRIYSMDVYEDNKVCDHKDPSKFLENEKQKRLCNVSVQLCTPDVFCLLF